jgi:hypothetical protein
MSTNNIVHNYFRIYSAKKFIEGLFEIQLSSNNLYIWMGKSTPWSNESAPTVPQDTVAFRRFEFSDMLALKKVAPNGATLVIPRNNWTSGTVYTQYSQNGAVYNSVSYDQFEPLTAVNPLFIFTDGNNIYKCLGNNSGATSSVKPTGRSTGSITTGDGYIWKFMYSLTDLEIQNFLDTNWVPITEVVFNDGSPQWAVQQAAVETSDSPPGGHGFNAVSELGAMYVMIIVQFQYDESGKLFTDNDFRKFGLIVNPKKYGSSQLYTALVAVATWNLTLSGITGTYSPDDHVTGGTSTATAKVLDKVGSMVRLTEVVGTFQVGEVLTDNTSAAIGVVATITHPDIQPNTGYFLTTEHQTPVVRASDQLEDFKTVLAF